MNYPTIRFVFDRKHKASRTTRGLVQVEVMYQRRRKWIGTGLHLLKHQWDEKSQRVKNSPTVLEDNEMLDTIMKNVKEIVHGIIKQTGGFSFATFSQKVDRVKNRESFLSFFRKFITSGTRSESRQRSLLVVLGHIEQHAAIKTFEDVTLPNIESFGEYLDRRGLKKSTQEHYHTIIKTVLDKAAIAGYVTYNPYNDFEVPESDSEGRCYLTYEELQAYRSVNVSDRLEVAKDFFVVQCMTGLSYSDLSAFSKDCTEVRGDKTVLLGKRIKSGVDYYVVLMKPVIEILEKYDYHFPRLHLSDLNNDIREVGKIAGITKHLSTHVGRHTFAVIALSNGIQIETVAKILGHKDIKTTQIYAKIVDSKVEADFKQLELTLYDN